MTDNEIKKALEYCSRSGWLNDCDGCPCYDKTEDIQTSECQERLMKNALDLINRQQAEIERYKGVIKLLENDVASAKSEAIKEFAERLKAKGDRYAWVVGISKEEINHLVKEMTEGNQ